MPAYRRFSRRSSRSSLRLLLVVCTAVALALPVLGTCRRAQAKAYKGAEVYSRQEVLYGRMEVRMRMIRGSGLLSTFFTYKDGSETSGALWGEIDIEALGKDDAKVWQSNLITGNPRSTSEQMHKSPTSLADDYHTYQIDWTPEYVSWSVDGVEVRRTKGGQAAALTHAHTLRFNVWSSESTGWVGALDESALPAYQFVNWIRYYRYENGQFVLDWTEDFDTLDPNRWSRGFWSFDGNRVDFDPDNAVVQDGTLILAITKEGATGFAGSVPSDPQGDASSAPIAPSTPTTPATSGSDSGCRLAPSHSSRHAGVVLASFGLLALACLRSDRWRKRRVWRLRDRPQ